MEQNYYKEYLKIISELNDKKPKLLLHVCCAPCSSHCLEELCRNFDIEVLFYNPNISPKVEFDKRYLEEVEFLRKTHPNIKVTLIGYEHENFIKISAGLESLEEGGERCFKCYKLRLRKTGEYAKKNNFDFFTTTLTLSPYKNTKKLNEIGKEIENEIGVKYLVSDFKKNNGYLNSINLSKKYNLYRQNYCGCEFSKYQSLKRKQAKEGGNEK